MKYDGKSVEVLVTNEGTADTEDVVQLYIKDEASPFAPVNPVLCGFQRVKISAGEKRRVELVPDINAFTVVNDQGERIPGSGKWTLYAGFSQPDGRSTELTGVRPVSITIG